MDSLYRFSGDIVTQEASLNHTNVRKFAQTNYTNFKEILKVYAKNDGVDLDPVFFAAFEDGYKDIEDDHEGEEFSAAGSFYHTGSNDTYIAKLSIQWLTKKSLVSTRLLVFRANSNIKWDLNTSIL
ncbi:MAG: hypothetical protein H7196_00700 [candidate division SR1 bacterium]|nr:hypothetical protein [candidate division SR1 bacterium]